jgi:hypothetical protein
MRRWIIIVFIGFFIISELGCATIYLGPVGARPTTEPFLNPANNGTRFLEKSTAKELSDRFGAPVLETERWAVFRICQEHVTIWYWAVTWAILPFPPMPLADIDPIQCQTIGCWFDSDGKVARYQIWWDDWHRESGARPNDREDVKKLRDKMRRINP